VLRSLQLSDDSELTSLQIEIDAALEREQHNKKKRKLNIAGTSIANEDTNEESNQNNKKRKLNIIAGVPPNVKEDVDESTETNKFIGESTIEVINECLIDGGGSSNAQNDLDGEEIEDPDDLFIKTEQSKRVGIKEETHEPESKFLGLKPDLNALCTITEREHDKLLANKKASETANDLSLEGLDDDEIDGYILTESEAVLKDKLWNQMNAEYLKMAKEREERAAKEREEGKPEKKKRKPRKKPIGPSSSAGEAIEKMLQEKKISSKINYDILKSLTAPVEEEKKVVVMVEEAASSSSLLFGEIELKTEAKVFKKPDTLSMPLPSTSRKSHVNLSNNRRSKPQMGLPIVQQDEDEQQDVKPVEPVDDLPGMLFCFIFKIIGLTLTNRRLIIILRRRRL
jgi:transcription factor IIIB subunit 2